MKQKKGISLIVLVITIIIMIIISGAIILTLTETNVIDQAEDATYAYNNKQYFELIRNEYLMLRVSDEAKGKTSLEIFEMLKDKINKNAEDVEYITGTKAMNITIDNTYKYTAFYDGEVKYGKYAYLDIADGSIQLKQTGYIQGTNPLVEYDGDYIITGTTTENNVQVMEEGTYNITIRDLNIDLRELDNVCAFNANAGGKATGNFVNIYIDGENSLLSNGNAAALGFPGAEPNIEEVKNASKLIIQGDGNLQAESTGFGAGIGTGYSGRNSAVGDANNIIINGGNITCKSGNSPAIGAAFHNNANNIIINGGNIKTLNKGFTGIGTRTNEEGFGILKNLQINGGNVTAYGGVHGSAIGCDNYSANGEILITGGRLNLINVKDFKTKQSAAFGLGCNNITITGGTIIAETDYNTGVGTIDITENINITGGNILITSAVSDFAVPPTSGANNVYLTELQLQNVTEEIEVTSFITSDNISYGIKDMYATNEGKLYVYLPTGERTITIKVGEKEYTGTVATGEADATEAVVLNEK